jgi:hypothetical protein
LSIYRPVATTIITTQYQPRHRQQLLRLLNRFDAIAGVFTFAILVFIVAPVAHHYPMFAVWPILYAMYLCARLLMTPALRRRETGGQHASRMLLGPSGQCAGQSASPVADTADGNTKQEERAGGKGGRGGH